jgi:hypothetical protein
MKGKVGICLLAIALVMAFAGFSTAQDKPADNMDLVKEKIRTDKKLFIAENMQLTESEAKVFWPIYDQFQADLGKIRDRSVKLIESFAKNYETMSNDMAKKLMDDSLKIKADDLKLRQSYLPKFRSVLPEKKVAGYYQLENKIDAVIAYQLATRIPLIKQ